jgi:hypothetical protein
MIVQYLVHAAPHAIARLGEVQPRLVRVCERELRHVAGAKRAPTRRAQRERFRAQLRQRDIRGRPADNRAWVQLPPSSFAVENEVPESHTPPPPPPTSVGFAVARFLGDLRRSQSIA